MAEINPILVDARNFDAIAPQIVAEMQGREVIGIDCETHNENAHPGIKAMNKGNKYLPDIRRLVMTGFSLYPEDSKNAYYINLNQADVENRVPAEKAMQLLKQKPSSAIWVAHNSCYEIIAFRMCYGVELVPDIVCTMQLAVSAYGPDEYPLEKFKTAGLGEIRKLIPDIARAFADFKGGEHMTQEQAELFGKVAGKASDAAWSYNGWVKEISYGYGLKKAVKSFFDYQMTTYKEALKGHAHMGELTGEEVVEYGCDDAYWAVRLYRRLLQYMIETNPAVIETFFRQENPMVEIFADIQCQGIRIDLKRVEEKMGEERTNYANALREMKEHFQALLPFPDEYHEKLLGEKWYAGPGKADRYRQRVIDWASTPNSDDDREEILKVNGATATGWEGVQGEGIINLTHYMPVRTIMYDLFDEKAIVIKGAIQSDKEARGKVLDRIKKRIIHLKEDQETFRLAGDGGSVLQIQQAIWREDHKVAIMEGMNKLARVDQVFKLYLNPYRNLVDPETGRIYPSISSMLATRRMSMSDPNGQQLAKRGESVYVRGFYLADHDDHVIISEDWSSIELVIPAELWQDPVFIRCFNKIPYDDLHSIAAADMVGLTEDEFKSLSHMPDEITHIREVEFKQSDGTILTPAKFKKWARTELGKGANFNYFFSGALGSIGEKLGWTSEHMWEMTEKYRQKFAVAEAGRVSTIQFLENNGYVELPDGHRRVRFEATPLWAMLMRQKFTTYNNSVGVQNFAEFFIRKQQTRAKNQGVNALIQGTAATIMKRSAIRLKNLIKEKYTPDQARFMLPIHDEKVFSVHRNLAQKLATEVNQVMCSHPDIFKSVILHATRSIGRTFEPFDAKKAPLGQIELDEAPQEGWIPKEFHEKVLPEDQVSRVIDYLFGDLDNGKIAA